MPLDRWNGDTSLLKDKHICKMDIDFENKTIKIYARYGTYDRDYSIFEFGVKPFTLASPFGMVAQGLRRLVSNSIAGGRY